MSMRKFLQKSGCLVIAGLFTVSVLLSGCTAKNVGEPSDSTTAQATSQATTQAPKEPPGVVKIFTADSAYIAKNYDQDLPVFMEIEKRLNIKLEWQLMPASGYEDALKIKLSAGTGMPDIFASWSQNAENLAKNGAIIALSDYFDSTMKNTQKVINEDPMLKLGLTSPDGKVYFLPRKTVPPNMAWLIRQDWLDKLNLNVPDTVEEFIDVLKQFRDKDPNGNGEKDEVPVAIRHIIYTYLYTMHNWGLTVVNLNDWVAKDNNGKFNVFLTRPEFKEVLTFVNTFYKEKLLNQDILTVDAVAYEKIITANRVGVIFGYLDSGMLNKIKAANPDVDAKWTVMLPPKGPRGDRGVRSVSSLDCPTYIAKGGNEKDATRFLDYIFADPEGRTLMTYGVEGLTYKENNGVKEFTDFVVKNTDGLNFMQVMYSVGAWPDKLCGMQDEYPKQFLDAMYAENPWITAGLELYKKNKMWDDVEPKYRFTTEEAAEITDIKAKLASYIDENVSKLIIGSQSMDTFDAFANSLKERGIERIVEIYEKVKARTK